MLMPAIFGENLFDVFFNDFDSMWPEKKAVRPAVSASMVMKTDVKETETGFELDIDLPGYKKDEVSAELKEGFLTITAKTESMEDKKDAKDKYIRRERYFGSCSRSFFVGKEIEKEDIKAKFENGTLKVFVPKKEELPKVEENRYIAIEG